MHPVVRQDDDRDPAGIVRGRRKVRRMAQSSIGSIVEGDSPAAHWPSVPGSHRASPPDQLDAFLALSDHGREGRPPIPCARWSSALTRLCPDLRRPPSAEPRRRRCRLDDRGAKPPPTTIGSRVRSGLAWKAGSQITLQISRMVVALVLARGCSHRTTGAWRRWCWCSRGSSSSSPTTLSERR